LHSLLVHYLRLFFHDFFGNLYYGFIDVELLFGADLEPFNVIFLQKLDLLGWDVRMLSLIAFVDEAIDAIFGRVLFGFFHPIGDNIIKGFGCGDIVDQDDCMSAFVIGFGDSSEAFLASSVPDLKFYIALLDVDGPV
jgi:hypothetical protein